MESRKMVEAVSKEGGKKAEAYLFQFGGVKLQFPIFEHRLLFPVDSTKCRRPPAGTYSFYAATFSNSVDRT